MLVNYVPRVPNASDFAYQGGVPVCVDSRNGDLYVMLTGVAPYNTIHKVTGSGGDVTGAAISVNNHVVFFDGTTGKTIKDSGLTLSGNNTGDQTSIVGITGTLAEFNAALTGADFATGGGTVTGTSSGTNTGDQTSIVGITGTLAQFNTALTGADFATGGGTVTGTSSGTNTGDQTNITGNAATVTTNANLTGPITSVGNATSVASQTGTGSTFVMSNAPAITGVTDASDAAAGKYGEYVTSTLGSGSATSLSTLTAKSVTSISLTAGDWDVDGIVNFITATTTNVVALAFGTSTTNNSLDGDNTFADYYNAPAGVVYDAVTIRGNAPTRRISVSSTTTVYLVAVAIFSVSTVTAHGMIRARRVR